MAKDNWGRAARFGIFIVGNEVVPEAEWWAMVPPGVSVHAARVHAPAPWAPWQGDDVALASDLERGAASFKGMALDAVVMAHTSSSVLGGQGWDQAVIKRLQADLHPNTKVTTNGLDCADALRAMAVTKPFVVFPPWFGDKLIAAGMDYFTALGFPEATHYHSEPGASWADVPRNELYARLMHVEQDVDLLFDQIVANGLFLRRRPPKLCLVQVARIHHCGHCGIGMLQDKTGRHARIGSNFQIFDGSVAQVRTQIVQDVRGFVVVRVSFLDLFVYLPQRV